MGLITEKLPHAQELPAVGGRLTSDVEGHLATLQYDMGPQPRCDCGLPLRGSSHNPTSVHADTPLPPRAVRVVC